MPSIGSSLPGVTSTATSSVGSPDVTDDGDDVGSPAPAPSALSDGFDAAPAKAPVALTPPPLQGIENPTTPAMAGADFKPAHVDVPWRSQDPKADPNYFADKDCRKTTVAMMEGANTGKAGYADPGGSDLGLPTGAVNADGKTSVDPATGRLNVDPGNAAIAKNYLDRELDAGNPVMVGVNRKQDDPNGKRNFDGVTDHFVVVTGRGKDADGHVYYTFNDPAARSPVNGSDQNPNNRFYVDDKTGLLYRPGTDGNLKQLDGKANPNYRQRYEVSQVRQNTIAMPALQIDIQKRN